MMRSVRVRPSRTSGITSRRAWRSSGNSMMYSERSRCLVHGSRLAAKPTGATLPRLAKSDLLVDHFGQTAAVTIGIQGPDSEVPGALGEVVYQQLIHISVINRQALVQVFSAGAINNLEACDFVQIKAYAILTGPRGGPAQQRGVCREGFLRRGFSDWLAGFSVCVCSCVRYGFVSSGIT